MKKLPHAILSILAVLSAAAGPAQATDEEITWLDDYTGALAEASQTGKPLLVAFRCVP